ncbi:MAG: hypothetical protein H6735_11540 [Alphaproteobacteria bacterium]|nr:hypothetical protein [Alphaproteobacteria bacterium]
MSTVRRLACFAAGLSLPATALAEHPVGSIVDNGVVLEINENGFGILTDMVGDLIPPRIDVPPYHSADASGCFLGACAYRYVLDLSGMWVEVNLDQLVVVPGTDALTMSAVATVNVNSAADPADLYVFAELATIDIFDDTCDLYFDPVHVTFDVPMTLTLAPDPNGVDVDGDGTKDTKRLDVQIPTPVWNWDADSTDFNFQGCALADTIDVVNEVTSFFGFDIYQSILDQMEPAVDAVVAAIPAAVEPILEDTFSSLTISEVVDLGVPMTFNVWPNAVDITPQQGQTPGALRIALSTAIDVPVADCVADYVGTGSASTPSSPPPVGDDGGVAFVPEISAFVDDDFVNYALYSAWAGGLLCYDLRSDDPSLALPIPLDTSLLAIIAPSGAFKTLFPEAAPMSILVDPKSPPITDPAGSHDVDILTNDLGLGFVAEVDGRRTRLFQVDASAVAGLDLNFDPLTGNLNFALDVDGDNFVATTTYGEILPSANDEVAGQFSALFDILAAPIISDLGNSLVFPPSDIEGLGILELDAAQTGPSGDWLGAYMRAGPVPYYSTGCDTSKKGKSCDTSSCDKGCSSSGGPIALFGFPLVVAALRRRRRR